MFVNCGQKFVFESNGTPLLFSSFVLAGLTELGGKASKLLLQCNKASPSNNEIGEVMVVKCFVTTVADQRIMHIFPPVMHHRFFKEPFAKE